MRIRVVKQTLERVDKDAKRRDIEKALRRSDEGERLEVQQLMEERQIEAIDRMEAERLKAELR